MGGRVEVHGGWQVSRQAGLGTPVAGKRALRCASRDIKEEAAGEKKREKGAAQSRDRPVASRVERERERV